MQAIGTASGTAFRNWLPALGVAAVFVVVALAAAAFGGLVALPILGVFFLGLVVAKPEYGIALLLSTFLITYPKALQGTGLLTINNVIGGVFLVLLTYKVYQEGDWWFIRCGEVQALLFIVLMYYLSNKFNSPDPRLVSLLGGTTISADKLRPFMSRVAFVIFFINYIRSAKHVRMIYIVALVFMIIASVAGVQTVLHGGGFAGYRAQVRGGAIQAAANPNRLAMFAILAIAGLFYFTQWLRIPGLFLVTAPTMAVLALAVFMTASRSGLLGLVVCGAVILLDQGLDLRRVLTMVLSGALLFLVLMQLVPQKSLERLTNMPFVQSQSDIGQGSLDRRSYTWLIGLEMFMRNPVLGVGIGNWELARFLADPTHSIGAPHSSFLLALCEGGIFCLLGFLVLLWLTWKNLRFAERYVSARGSPLADFEWVVRSAKVSFLVLVFFSLVADLWQLVVVFWIVGISIVVRRLVEQQLVQDAAAY